jgi:NhaA family Na+:H+ antiporter
VTFLIMPLFALANTGIVLAGNWADSLLTSNSLGILVGLVLGKPLGIVLCTFVAVTLRVSQLPSEVMWRHIIGAGFLSGIGFTMSIFITLLAFGNPDLIHSSKLSILLSSLVAGTTGFLILQRPASGTAPRPL